MSELRLDSVRQFPPGETQNVDVSAYSKDLQSLHLDLTTHYQNMCKDTVRQPQFDKLTHNLIDAVVASGAKTLSAQHDTPAALAEQLKVPEKRLEFESGMNDELNKVLKGFCLQSDGIEIKKLEWK